MSEPERVRFCNNPLCGRLDEHLRPGEVLVRAGRELCPDCHEELLARAPRPRRPRLRTAPAASGRDRLPPAPVRSGARLASGPREDA